MSERVRQWTQSSARLPVRSVSGHWTETKTRTVQPTSNGADENRQRNKKRGRDETKRPATAPPPAATLTAPSTAVASHRERVRLLIGLWSDLLISDPTRHSAHLRDLIETATRDHDVTVRALAVSSAAEVFVDIIPDFIIAQRTDDDMIAVSAEIRSLRRYERHLLAEYSLFVDALTADVRRDMSGLHADHQLSALIRTRVVSLCRLAENAFHFNLREEIIGAVVALTAHRNAEVREVSCRSLRNIFARDKVGDATRTAVQHIRQRATAPMKSGADMRIGIGVSAETVNTLLALSTAPLEDDIGAVGGRGRVGRKWRKVSSAVSERDLERDMDAGAGRVSAEHRRRVRQEIVADIAAVYFTILCEFRHSQLVRAALVGLRHFTALINADVTLEFVSTLLRIIDGAVTAQQTTINGETLLSVVVTCLHVQRDVIGGDTTDMKAVERALSALLDDVIADSTRHHTVAHIAAAVADVKHNGELIRDVVRAAVHAMPSTSAVMLDVAARAIIRDANTRAHIADDEWTALAIIYAHTAHTLPHDVLTDATHIRHAVTRADDVSTEASTVFTILSDARLAPKLSSRRH